MISVYYIRVRLRVFPDGTPPNERRISRGFSFPLNLARLLFIVYKKKKKKYVKLCNVADHVVYVLRRRAGSCAY